MDDFRKYLYICLMEEAAEVIKEAAKVLRFGEDTPVPEVKPVTNLERLQAEIIDLTTVVRMLGYLPAYSKLKEDKVNKYFKVSNELTGP